MGRYIINGGNQLHGEVALQGSKNAVLPIFAAAILTNQKVVIKNCPNLVDVTNMAKILESLGATVSMRNDVVEIEAIDINTHEIQSTLTRELRSSIFLLGSILGRVKQAKVAYPGGCDIGLRPIDIHLKGLKALNVKIVEKYGYIYCDATKMRGGVVNLDYPSVGATENVMLASATTTGKTLIHNPAREPEIVDLQNFLNSMGAKISGAGSGIIEIIGVEKLHGTEYTTMSDRIVLGTLLMATAIVGGNVRITNCQPNDINALIYKLSKNSCKIVTTNDTLEVVSDERLDSLDYIETQPYPGFPTDLQAPMTTLATVTKGVTIITENIFETRFKHVPELIKMGANIKVKDKTAIIRGVERLTGAEVCAMDLRGGAALVLAGLNAKGTTIINDIKHVERGYEDLHTVLKNLGADIIKI